MLIGLLNVLQGAGRVTMPCTANIRLCKAYSAKPTGTPAGLRRKGEAPSRGTAGVTSPVPANTLSSGLLSDKRLWYASVRMPLMGRRLISPRFGASKRYLARCRVRFPAARQTLDIAKSLYLQNDREPSPFGLTLGRRPKRRDAIRFIFIQL